MFCGLEDFGGFGLGGSCAYLFAYPLRRALQRAICQRRVSRGCHALMSRFRSARRDMQTSMRRNLLAAKNPKEQKPQNVVFRRNRYKTSKIPRRTKEWKRKQKRKVSSKRFEVQ